MKKPPKYLDPAIYMIDDHGGLAVANTEEQAAAFEMVGFRRVTFAEYMSARRRAKELDAQAADDSAGE